VRREYTELIPPSVVAQLRLWAVGPLRSSAASEPSRQHRRWYRPESAEAGS